tara:strand:+ start:224 stop:493 length:270 start_codon:yes stop_codon:yes gene_type:complete
MEAFDVGQGPVSFARRFEPVPGVPAPSLGATMTGGYPQVGRGLLVLGTIVAVGATGAAIFKGEKKDRSKNARLLGITAVFGAMALGLSA